MIFPENQVRNFYVAKSIKTGSAAMTTAGDIKAHQKGDKYWFEYVDANGKTITSDIIRIKNIRDIRISLAEGFNGRVWGVSIDTTGMQPGDVCLMHFDLGNIFGFGEGEKFYYEYPVIFTAGMTGADLLKKFENILAETSTNAQGITVSGVLKYNKVMASVFKSITYNSTDNVLYFQEAEQEYNGLLGYYPHPVSVKIDADAVRTLPAGGVQTMNPFTIENVNDPSATGTYTNAPAAQIMTNGYKIAAMERYFSKVRADLYGYMGYPDVNPSAMIMTSADLANTYYTLDIKYYTQLSGVNNQNSEKEMTIAAVSLSDLTLLINGLNFTISPKTSTSTLGYIGNTSSWRSNYGMLTDYFRHEEAAGRVPGNKDAWNGDGWIVLNFYQPEATKFKYSYDGVEAIPVNINTGSTPSTYIIISVTDPADGIGATLETFDMAKFTYNFE